MSEDSKSRQRLAAAVVYPSKEWVRKHYPDCQYDGLDGWGDAPDDWKVQLENTHIAALISPFHYLDKNPDSTFKKPHFHVLLLFDSPKSDNQIDAIFTIIHGVREKESIHSKRGYARYLCHLDNPEKHQYNPTGVTELSGANYNATIHLATDDQEMLNDLLAFIRVNQIGSFAELVDITAICNSDWNVMATTSRSYTIKEYIKSLNWEYNSGYVRLEGRHTAIINPKTGEIMMGGEDDGDGD